MLGVTAKFKVDAVMEATTLPTSIPITLEVELQNIAQLISSVVDTIVDCVRSIIDWDWVLDGIRSFLSILSIDKFKFGLTMKDGVMSEFKIDLGLLISNSPARIHLKVDAFDNMLGMFKQWGNKIITNAIGFLDFPPFPNGCGRCQLTAFHQRLQQ